MKLGLFYAKLRADYNRLAASYWIRLLQMVPYYQGAGMEVSVNNPFKRYDVAIFFRDPRPKYLYFMKYLKNISRHVYFDTCINLFDEHEEINIAHVETSKKIAGVCERIIAASDTIAEKAKPYAKVVHVMDDPINFTHFTPTKQHVNLDNPVFGWSGVRHKALFLNAYWDELPRIRLITSPNIKGLPLKFEYEYSEWNYHTFQEELKKCDVGFLPRKTDDPYNSGHSSFKALVFASLGIPVVASKIPSYVKLSYYYDGIVFLEDHENSIQQCIDELKNRNLNNARLRAYYSCENQATLMADFLSNNLDG